MISILPTNIYNFCYNQNKFTIKMRFLINYFVKNAFSIYLCKKKQPDIFYPAAFFIYCLTFIFQSKEVLLQK
ncbi:MAG: hypothetical protein H6Q19_818 [Bacteroidetes bacterium]|nr:hypothetical protein [Bacteroidota bacterium]